MTEYFDQEWRDRKAQVIAEEHQRIGLTTLGAACALIGFMIALGVGSAIGGGVAAVALFHLIRLDRRFMANVEELKKRPASDFRDV